MVDTVQIPEAIKYPEYDSSTFKINIKGMKVKECNGTSDVVYFIDYEIVATLSSGVKRRFEGSVEYDDQVLNEVSSFTPFSDLAESDVISWIEAYTDVENIKRGLTQPERTDDTQNVTPPWAN